MKKRQECYRYHPRRVLALWACCRGLGVSATRETSPHEFDGSRERRPVSIHTVARLAGTSPMTVSRVLNGSPLVAQATRERVLEAMRRLDYRPNNLARSLARLHSPILGLFLSEGASTSYRANPFYLEILSGAHAAARGAGYDLLLLSGQYDDDASLRTRILGFVSGLLVVSGTTAQTPDTGSLGLPMVCIGRRDAALAGVPCVQPDYRGAVHLLVRELHQAGHTALGFLLPSTDFLPDAEKLGAFQEACRAHGLTPSVREGVRTQHEAYLAVRETLEQGRVTAVITANADLLAGAIMARGSDAAGTPLTVTGFNDNDYLVEQMALTVGVQVRTLRVPAETLGYQAGQLLVGRIREGSKRGWTAGDEVREVVTVPIPLETVGLR